MRRIQEPLIQSMYRRKYLVTLDLDGNVLAVKDHFTSAVRFYSMAIQGSSIYCSGQTQNDTAAFGPIRWVGPNPGILYWQNAVDGNPIWVNGLYQAVAAVVAAN